METTEVHHDLIGMKYDDVVTKLDITEDHGGCCGYASCEVSGIPDSVDPEKLILKGCTLIEYDSHNDDRKVLNFLFENDLGNQYIYGLDCQAGSGSGWSYGAYVSVKLGDKELVEASW